MDSERAARIYTSALKANVELTPPEAPYVDRNAVFGLRVCLGTPLERDVLEDALRAVKEALEAEHTINTKGIV